MQNTANRSSILSKDDKKSSKPALHSQPLNETSSLNQNEPQSNNNQASSSQRGCKKEKVNRTQSHHDMDQPDNASKIYKLAVTDSNSLEMLDQLLKSVDTPKKMKRRATAKKDPLDSHQVENDMTGDI